ncbi:MAG: metal ABC transporter substrate-binding protein [Oscillospiraceae bacterium]|jgi:zinc transport system substrate-binding protein|nr:metal ABC transporter substrate-binding protein [Oscillospiraceae bacterium]
MKKLIALVLMSVLIITLAACKPGTDANADVPASGTEQADKISVVATIFPPYDFTREVAGDYAEITMLLPPAAESHSFEPSQQDIIKIQNCDVFIYVGGESDEWVERVLASLDTSNMEIITLMDCVDVVEEEVVEGMEDEEEEEAEESEGGEEEPELDEHVWTSPRNAKLITEKISNVLQSVDAENSAVYAENTAAYLSKLDELDAKFQDVVDNAARKTFVFGDRFPFRYFADAYGLDYYAAFPGCSTETEASAATIAFLIDKVNEEQIPVVFHIELANTKIADAIAEQSGAKVLELHACHNISKSDFEAGETYLSIMTRNVDALREALA